MGDTKQEEISFTYQFLKYVVNSGKPDIYPSFAWRYAKEPNDAVKEFCNRIVLPFVNYIEGYLTEIGIKMGYDENTQFSINVTGGNPQLNIASGNGVITATQNNGIDINQLESIIEEIKNIASSENFGKDKIEEISESLDTIKAELTSLQPKKGLLRTTLRGLQAISGSVQFIASVATLSQLVLPNLGF